MVELKKIRIIFLLVGIFISGCALQLPPEGGEIDLIPPKIISTYPENGTLNFSEKYFEVKFSEYVDKRSFREAIFISPTVEGEMKINWSGRTAEVYFPNGFKENTTYVVTIGTDVVDLNNRNRMANAFTLTFSTGTKIDNKVIAGKVYDSQVDGTMVFAYHFKSDTTNYLLKKADYISQCGKEGNYSIKGLPEGKFRIFAVKDQFRDLIFQAEQDLIGIPFMDVELSENDSAFTGLNFFLTKYDTIPPRITEARMLDEKHILVKFSEDINLKELSKQSFSIIDTNANLVSYIRYYFSPLNKPNELILIPQNLIDADSDVLLEVNNIKDNFDNVLLNEKISFVTTDKQDTFAVKISRTEPIDYKIDFQNPSIKIFFDDAIQKDSLTYAFSFYDLSDNKIPFDISSIDDAAFEIIPSQRLKPDSKYKLEINLKLLPDALGNITDSTVIMNFITRSEFEFSSLSGKIVAQKENLILVLESEQIPSLKYFTKVKNNQLFEFERVLPGRYKLWAFADENKNGKYDFGSLKPFNFSEKFYFYPETIELRARWGISDLVFTID